VSAISIAEILAGPWKAGDANTARTIEDSLRGLPNLAVADVTLDVASAAARLRGQTNLPLADSLILASMMRREVQVVVTNDIAWRVKGLPSKVLILEDYVPN
jgi:predicted nucleic acid-binding protein